MAGLIQLAQMPLQALLHARGMLFPWVTVFLGVGIGLWFGLPFEPSGLFYSLILVIFLGLILLRQIGPELLHPVAIALAACLCGLLATGFRAHTVAAPVLEGRYYGPIEGRIIGIDRSQSDALRLTLDQVRLDRMSPAKTPVKVRISLHGDQPFQGYDPGQIIMLTGHLSAPEGPVEPGTFDFRRMAFFDQLGAVGYTRTPVLLLAPPEQGAQQINRLRTYLSAAMREAMPGQAGAFAAGAMTGDRSGITLETVQALRDSSLAHLLAISGMNLAFLIGFVFVLIRRGIALVPPVALRVNAKKVAAVIGLLVAGFYLLLSGANVATERAFIMVSVMLGAVLLDRRAITLRSVAIAGLIILVTKPESLMEPGFQMSFAATVALIAAYGAVDARVARNRLPRLALPVFTLILSSVVAGFATAPYAGAHFNRFTDYGLLANLLTVPVMGAVVMPAGAVAALLAPFGLAAPALWVMEAGSRWILFIAHTIAGWDGSVTGIPAPGAAVLPLITLGALWLILWQGRVRFAGVVVIGGALMVWAVSSRPLLLIDSGAGLVGLMGPDGRALSAPSGAGFAAKGWLENDGDLGDQVTAADRAGFQGDTSARQFSIAGLRAISLKGKAALTLVDTACAKHDLVIINQIVTDQAGGCVLLDTNRLSQTGALAGWPVQDGLLLIPSQQHSRLWSPPRPAQDPVLVRQNPGTIAATDQ